LSRDVAAPCWPARRFYSGHPVPRPAGQRLAPPLAISPFAGAHDRRLCAFCERSRPRVARRRCAGTRSGKHRARSSPQAAGVVERKAAAATVRSERGIGIRRQATAHGIAPRAHPNGFRPPRCRVADRFSRGHRADVGCPVHERVESARPVTAASTTWHPSSSS
jgi:hypothetical protein